jgi:hypothetical protein
MREVALKPQKKEGYSPPMPPAATPFRHLILLVNMLDSERACDGRALPQGSRIDGILSMYTVVKR